MFSATALRFLWLAFWLLCKYETVNIFILYFSCSYPPCIMAWMCHSGMKVGMNYWGMQYCRWIMHPCTLALYSPSSCLSFSFRPSSSLWGDALLLSPGSVSPFTCISLKRLIPEYSVADCNSKTCKEIPLLLLWGLSSLSLSPGDWMPSATLLLRH